MDTHKKREVLRFLLAGGFNTGLMYSFYVLLLWLGVSYPVALSIEYIVGIPFSYLLQRYWTFMPQGQLQLSFLKYVLTYIAVFAVNAVLLVAIVETGMLGPVLGQFLALAVVVVGSYGAQKLWVFKTGNTN